MGTSLTGLTPSATYTGLLKFGDNSAISASLKLLSDGAGNDTLLSLSNSALQIGNNTSMNARLGIKGSGSTSATTSLLVQNSAGTSLLSVNDAGTITAGGSITASGLSSTGAITYSSTISPQQGGSYIAVGQAGGFYSFNTITKIGSPSDGVITLSNLAVTDFNRLQLGGTTSAFPSLKRSSTTLQARLADDSAFAPLQGKLTTDTAYTATPVVSSGYITIYDSTGTAYKVLVAL